MKVSKRLLLHWPAVVLTIMLAIVLLASFAPAKAAAAKTTTGCTKSYEIKRGDTLQKISERFGYSPSQIVYVNGWNHPYTIYVGQKMCIPTSTVSNPPKVNSTEANTVAAYFTAGRTATDVLIYPYTYPNGHVVIVKVDNASDSVKKFVNVGKFTIGNGKTFRFKLPANLQNASKLSICLKDTTTNYLQCVVPRSGG